MNVTKPDNTTSPTGDSCFPCEPDSIIETLKAYQAAVNEAALVTITDLTGRILYANHRFMEVSGFGEEELMGQPHSVVNSGLHPKTFFEHLWATIQSGRHWRGEVRNRTRSGGFFWVDTIITPVAGKDGKTFQYLAIRNVISRQKENEAMLLQVQQEVIKREQQLKEAQQIAKTGSWYHNANGDILEWSEETYNILELPPDTPASHDLFIQHIHPGDRSTIQEAWGRALSTGEVFDADYRLLTTAGEKWVRSRARLTCESTGAFKTALGTIQDITRKKRTEDALRESEVLYKSLFNNSPFSIGIVEKSSYRFVEVNETAIDLYGYSREEFLQLTVLDIREAEAHDKVKKQLTSGTYAADRSMRIHRKKNGEIIIASPTITEIEYQGKPVYLITIQDITEHSRIEAALQEAKSSRQKDLVQAQEESRSAIGRELHDNINQLLVASALYIKNATPASHADREMIETGLRIMAEANEEIRRLSASLVVPRINEVNLQDSMESLCHCLKLSKIDVKLKIVVDDKAIPEDLKINIYRIVQEQVKNIIKYAQAGSVCIRIEQSQNLVSLEILDDGKGFDMKEVNHGIGLKNMAYRAEAYNGELKIEAAPGDGCSIYAKFPIRAVVSTCY